jgi:hypothetical protein
MQMFRERKRCTFSLPSFFLVYASDGIDVRVLGIAVAYLLGIIGFGYFLSSWTFTPGSFYWANYVEGRVGTVY